MKLIEASLTITLLVTSAVADTSQYISSLRRRDTGKPLDTINASSNAITAKSSSRSFQAKLDKDDYNMNFQFAPDCKIQFKSNPKAGNISIRKLGSCKLTKLSLDDKDFLKNLADELVSSDTIETDEVDKIGTQSARAATLLTEWPEGLDWKLDYDPSKERTKKTVPDFDPSNFPAVPVESQPNGNRKQRVLPDKQDHDQTGGHHYRRLAYTSLCSYINSYYYVTHDDFSYNRDDPRTSYYAYLSMTPAGPCSDGTYFWKNNNWQCYEPDHDSTVDYAYGNCFGRCGAGCGTSRQFTRDCADVSAL
jgi:hypothetical protein